ncbi:glycosyltransferase family 2 protein [candidate division KSB1 bacterium]|nr:glycosyltransferase family 2 protein [candidate division KSB1 bacterium]
MRVVILIPAYNSAATLGDVLSKCLEQHSRQALLVVDDGSSDDSIGIAKHFGVPYISHAKNQGKGAALRTGFRRILQSNADAILTLDSDGQHDPTWIPSFIRSMTENNWDLVIGSRMHDLKTMPFDRQFSNKTTSKILSFRCGCKIEDSQCGYRLIRTSVLRQIELTTNQFDTETEIVLKACLKGFKIGFVPISTIYHQGGGSSIRRASDTMRFLRVLVRSFFW